jgi:3-phosphoshikimate 1-carboxyvinyltransferase
MLWRYGVHFSCEDDILTIEGQHNLERAYIDSYKDHRIVMAAAVCALKAKGTVTITHAEAVNKSYPDFFSDMGRCGMRWNYL